MTIDCSKEIIASAQCAGDSKILAIGKDLIAKEAQNHHSCRRNYLRDHRKQGIEPGNQMSKKRIVMMLHFQSCLLSLKKQLFWKNVLNQHLYAEMSSAEAKAKLIESDQKQKKH